MYAWVHEALIRAGQDLHTGLSLYRIFIEAGLSAPQMTAHARVEAGAHSPFYEQIGEILRTLLPAIERFRIASADEVQIDTIAERLRNEAVSQQSVLMTPTLIGAWTRK
jgi:hypothetical protein